VIATGLAVTATVLLVGGGHGRRADVSGVACGLVAGCAYAVFTLACSTAIRRGCDSRSVMAASFLGAGVLMSPLILAAGGRWVCTPAGAAVIGYLALIATVGAYLLYGRGLESTPATTAATLTLTEPAIATLIGLLLLRERITPGVLLGLFAMAVALIMFARPGADRPAASDRAGTQPGSRRHQPSAVGRSPEEAGWSS
jgi:DME family drug/metabolite transporter